MSNDIFELTGKAKIIEDRFERFIEEYGMSFSSHFDKEDGQYVEQWSLHNEGKSVVIHIDLLTPNGLKSLSDFIFGLLDEDLIEDKPFTEFVLEDEDCHKYIRLLVYLPIKED